MPIRPISTGLPVTQFEDPVSAPTEGMLNATATLAALGPRLAEIKAEKDQRRFQNDREVAGMGVDPGHGGIWSQVAGKVSDRQADEVAARKQHTSMEQARIDAGIAEHVSGMGVDPGQGGIWSQVAGQAAGDRKQRMTIDQAKADAAIAAHKAAEGHWNAEEGRAQTRMLADGMKGIWGALNGPKEGTPRDTGLHILGKPQMRIDQHGKTHIYDGTGNEVAPGTKFDEHGNAIVPEPAAKYEDPVLHNFWRHGQPTTTENGIFSAQPTGETAHVAAAPVDPMEIALSRLHPDDQKAFANIMASGDQQRIKVAQGRLLQLANQPAAAGQ